MSRGPKYQRGTSDVIGCLFAAPFFLFFGAAWLTHVITCFEQDRWGFLIAGAIFFPVAIVHGMWIWFH